MLHGISCQTGLGAKSHATWDIVSNGLRCEEFGLRLVEAQVVPTEPLAASTGSIHENVTILTFAWK